MSACRLLAVFLFTLGTSHPTLFADDARPENLQASPAQNDPTDQPHVARKPSADSNTSQDPTARQSTDKPGSSRLARVLVGRNESLRQRALAGLSDDLAAKIASLGDLQFALRHHAENPKRGELALSTVEMVNLIASTNRPDAEQFLVEMLDSEQVAIAMICADALGRHQYYDSIDTLKMQVERPEWKTKYGFRFNLVRALVQMDHPDAYEFLKYVKRTLDGQLLHELEEQFSKVTLDDFRGDDSRFASWKQGIKGRESMFKAASFSESADRMRLERQDYYGIDIDAKRIMFIIDHSGSMKKPVYRGTRLTAAKNELVKAIKSLPEDHEFAIVFYESTVREWRNELVYASEKNKQDAIRFIGRLHYGDSTNTYGALRRSLEFDDDLETVFLLTDGRPTCGQFTAPPQIVNDIVHRNKLRHLTINTIGIAVGGTTENFLKTLAQQCGGEYRSPD